MEYMLITLVIVVSLVCTLLFTPLVAVYAANRRLYDLPGGRRVHKTPVPRLGGVAIFSAIVLSNAVFLQRSYTSQGHLVDGFGFYVATILGATIIFVTGLRDDLYGLRPFVKLIFQVAAAAVVYVLGIRFEEVMVAPAIVILVGWLSFPLTVAWIVCVTNAINLIDGLDGLAAGIVLVALTSLIAIGSITADFGIVVMAASMSGALVGFLVYNFNPAKIFLGDSGSYLIGFMLAVLALRSSFTSDTELLAVVPVVLLGLPLLDVALAIGRRWLKGVPVFDADAGHIHHRLLALGLTHRGAVLTLYGITSLFALISIILVVVPPTAISAGILAAIGVAILLGYGIRILGYHEFKIAGSVLAAVPTQFRDQIRFRIREWELARAIENCRDLAQVNELLAKFTSQLGVLRIHFGPQGDPAELRTFHHQRSSIKIEVPVRHKYSDAAPSYVLRVWCSLERDWRSSRGERVGHALLPTLRRFLDRNAAVGVIGDAKHEHATVGGNGSDTSQPINQVVAGVPV